MCGVCKCADLSAPNVSMSPSITALALAGSQPSFMEAVQLASSTHLPAATQHGTPLAQHVDGGPTSSS